MNQTKTSNFSNGLIWFGAAVSIAEILTGTLIAPLGFAKGISAILLGHFIGCVLLFLSGLIGARSGKSGMETVKMSFGKKGSLLFSTLNILQLVGWTAVMISSGASAAGGILSRASYPIWCAVIGVLILVWILVGIKNLNKINTLAMGLLFILSIVLCIVIFGKGAGDGLRAADSSMSFGAAVELSVAMPLSWLPLISDYTRFAKKPVGATAASSIVYFAASSWMYVIGLGAAMFTGATDIGQILLKAGLGVAALLIIVFSTVTTTFLDVYSAGVSSESISKKFKEKPVAIAVCIIGTILAIAVTVSKFESFLYLIGSVFAPMIAVQIASFFILKEDFSSKDYNWPNIVIWIIGFAIYRFSMQIETPLGNTLPVIAIIIFLCLVKNISYIFVRLKNKM